MVVNWVIYLVTKSKQPEWHGPDCNTAYRNMQETAKFLQRDPKNSYLRGKIQKEKKSYKKLMKQQQGKFLAKMFEQLDECGKSDPKKYMEIVKKIPTRYHLVVGGTIFPTFLAQKLKKLTNIQWKSHL